MIAIEKGDYETALKELRPLAEKGDAYAQYNLGRMYAKGEAVLQDYKEAAKWVLLAAKQGIPIAQYNIGVMYQNGFGVPQDNKEAIRRQSRVFLPHKTILVQCTQKA